MSTEGRAPGAARLAIVVLNYRTPKLALACVESVVSELDPTRDRLLVVDNASGDGSAAAIRAHVLSQHWPVEVVESPRNEGFGGGMNLGIASADAQAYLLLNSDTVVRPGAVAALWQALVGEPRVGLVGPRIEHPDGTPQPSCFRVPTPISEFIAGSDLDVVRRALRRWDVLATPARISEQGWLSFAAVMIRREVIREIGPLDVGYFMYFEDVDYCLRARSRGWRLGFVADARIVHTLSGSSGVDQLREKGESLPRYYYRARSRFFRRWYGAAGLLLANLLRSLGFGAAQCARLATGRGRAVRGDLAAIWRA